MNEERAREIYKDSSTHNYTIAELRQCDEWIRNYTLERFEIMIAPYCLQPQLREFLMSSVKLHFGAWEANRMFTAMRCYPDWMMS